MYALARRAQLEDDLALLDEFDPDEIADLLLEAASGDDDRLRDAVRGLSFAIGRLKSLAGGRISIVKEMRELDKRFGLDPKALAENRWTVAEPEPEEEAPTASVRRLRAVDAA
jgi:hypothetical protein